MAEKIQRGAKTKMKREKVPNGIGKKLIAVNISTYIFDFLTLCRFLIVLMRYSFTFRDAERTSNTPYTNCVVSEDSVHAVRI